MLAVFTPSPGVDSAPAGTASWPATTRVQAFRVSKVSRGTTVWAVLRRLLADNSSARARAGKSGWDRKSSHAGGSQQVGWGRGGLAPSREQPGPWNVLRVSVGEQGQPKAVVFLLLVPWWRAASAYLPLRPLQSPAWPPEPPLSPPHFRCPRAGRAAEG